MSSTIPGAPANPSPQLEPIIAFLEALKAFNFDILEDYLTKDFKRYTLPKSLEAQEPFHTASVFIESLRTHFATLKSYEFSINEISEAPGLVVVHGSSVITTLVGKSYNNEYMMVQEVEKEMDGTYKIKVLKEFVDSKLTLEYYSAEFQSKVE